jgi:hypothetical protein
MSCGTSVSALSLPSLPEMWVVLSFFFHYSFLFFDEGDPTALQRPTIDGQTVSSQKNRKLSHFTLHKIVLSIHHGVSITWPSSGLSEVLCATMAQHQGEKSVL